VKEREIGRLPLVGLGGEPVDFWATVIANGLNELPPFALDAANRSLAVTVRLPVGPRTLRLWRAPGVANEGVVAIGEPEPTAETVAAALATLRAMLRLDCDLADFHVLAAADPELAWVTTGAGRMMRGQTVFEDVVKTICTTNCAWSATRRMVAALVARLGEAAPDAPVEGPLGRAFPEPAAMAGVDETFYREVVRAGYRGRYLIQLARAVVEGRLDLEAFATATPEALPDDELAKRLLALPGVGPYAAAHVMLLLGRCSRLVFDSWTRPTYARLTDRTADPPPDAEIADRFRRYGPHAGRAFWLFLTRGWLEESTDGVA
jgi:N-glycosylase/DNA lyase